MSDTNINNTQVDQTTQEHEELINEIILEADGTNDGLSLAETEYVGLSDYDQIDVLEDEEDADGL